MNKQIKITDYQSYALVIRDVFFFALKSDPFFAKYNCRRTAANVSQVEHLPFLGVTIVDETMVPDGDANAPPIAFTHTLKIGFSVIVAHNDQDMAEATIDAAWWRIMHRLLTDAKITNVYYSTNPDNTLIEAITRGVRRHVFGATGHNQQTPTAELRYEMSVTFRTMWKPIIPDDLLLIDVKTGVKMGDTAEEMLERWQAHVAYEFEPSPPEIDDLAGQETKPRKDDDDA